LINKLVVEAAARFGSVHQNPEVAAISSVEMQALTDKYQTSILLEAFRRVGHVVKKGSGMSHVNLLVAIYNLAARVQGQDTRHARGIPSSTTPHRVPTAKTQHTSRLPKTQPVNGDVLDMREEFQEQVTYQDWTLTEQQAKDYLQQAGSAKVMREAMQKLRKYSVAEFEEALSALNAAIDQTLWMKEVVLQ
jgi:hypothetical protein